MRKLPPRLKTANRYEVRRVAMRELWEELRKKNASTSGRHETDIELIAMFGLWKQNIPVLRGIEKDLISRGVIKCPKKT